jgi:hypothetical protein
VEGAEGQIPLRSTDVQPHWDQLLRPLGFEPGHASFCRQKTRHVSRTLPREAWPRQSGLGPGGGLAGMPVATPSPHPRSAEPGHVLRPLVCMLARQAVREILNSQCKEKEVDHDDEDVGEDLEEGTATDAG